MILFFRGGSKPGRTGRAMLVSLGLLLAICVLAAPVSGARGDDKPKLDFDLKDLTPAKIDPKLVIERIEDLMRGDTNYSEMKMTVYNPVWPRPRSYEMKSWEDRKAKKSFIRITAPARDRGTAFLKDGYVFKVYYPGQRENKPMTVPPSLMLQPWMGSDFTNDDLVRESSIINDYKHTVEGIEKDDQGRTLIRIRMDPKPDAAVVWGKLLYWVDAQKILPVRQEYFDEDGTKVRVMILSEFKTMDGRLLPTRWEMESLTDDRKGGKTVLEIEDIDFGVKIDDDVFTEKNLTRRDWE